MSTQTSSPTGTYFDDHPTAKGIIKGLVKGGIAGTVTLVLGDAVASLPASFLTAAVATTLAVIVGALVFADEAVFYTIFLHSRSVNHSHMG